jgi:hypothetical protein
MHATPIPPFFPHSQSGVLDECGVCDGMSRSCALVLTIPMAVSPGVMMGNSVQAS